MTILGPNKTFLGVFHILSTSPIVASTIGQKLLKFCTQCCNVILSFAQQISSYSKVFIKLDLISFGIFY